MSADTTSAAQLRRGLDRRREQWLVTGDPQTLTSDEALQEAMNLFNSSAKQGDPEGLPAFIGFLRLRANFLEPSQARKEAEFIDMIFGIFRAEGIEIVEIGAPGLGEAASRGDKRRRWRMK